MQIPVITPEQSNQWDERAERAGIPRATLMESAGRAAAAVVADRYAHVLPSGVLVAAGPGNNGGDGWVLARALHRADVPVWVAGMPSSSELCASAAEIARAEGVRHVAPDGPWPTVALAVDALLGTGATGSPRPAVATLLDRIVDLEIPVASIDGPTGLDLLSGVVHGPARADLSITFGGLRRGHLLARDEVGALVVVDIGHPPPDPCWPTLVTSLQAAEWQQRLHPRDHKGDRGRVVIVGGAPGMSGALRMAARAAFGAGAGLVHAVAPTETIAQLVQAEPDVQTFSHPFDTPPSAELLDLVAKSDALAIGPGLGRSPGRRAFVAALVQAASRVVIDADGLIAFAGAESDLRRLADGRSVVLTPHPGEFRTLFPALASTRELDPWSAAVQAAERSATTLLLKGVPTVIASPSGAPLTVAAGNPGLATGGSGDILTGLVGAGLAQGLEPITAAAVAAQALGGAADIAARRFTARAVRPMDVVAALPDVWRDWEMLQSGRTPSRPPLLLELPRPQTV